MAGDARTQFANMLAAMHGQGGDPQPGGGGMEGGWADQNAPQGPPNGEGQGPLAAFAQAAAPPGSANADQTMQMVSQLQRLYPKLKVVENDNGKIDLVGPAQEQFLGAAWAKAHGAHVAKVANEGRGQRLQVGWH